MNELHIDLAAILVEAAAVANGAGQGVIVA